MIVADISNLLMLNISLWMLLITNLQCVHTLHPIGESKGDTCDSGTEDYCPQTGRIQDLYREATEISQCINAETNDTGVNVEESVRCLVREARRNLEKLGQNFTKISQTFQNAELELMSNHSQKTRKYKCLYCVISELNLILNSMNYFNENHIDSLFFKAKHSENILRIFKIFLLVQNSQNSSHFKDNFFDIETWGNLFVAVTNNTLDTEEIRKEVDRIIQENGGDRHEHQFDVKNCGFGSECPLRPILFILYAFAIAANGLLIFIFIRHREIRSDRNKIILNLAIADILSVLCNASIQIIFIYGGTFQAVRLYYRISDLSLEVTTGVCIYSIVVLSIQRYFAVVPTHDCSQCGVSRRFNSTLFICVLWALGCVPQVIHVSAQFNIRVWAMRNLVLYCLIPIVTMATFYMMTSWRLKKSVRKMPGEAFRHETAKDARVRSSNVLIALIAVFALSYTPIQVFRFIELWFYGGGYLFDYVDLIAYSMLSLNSCFNPIALYVASGTFRRYFNRYICFYKNNLEVNLSRSNTNAYTTNKTCVAHV